MVEKPKTLEEWNARTIGLFPDLLGARFEKVTAEEVAGGFDVRRTLFAPNGYLHAGAVVTLADTACGFGAICALPEGALGFTTVDLAANFLSTAKGGRVSVRARPKHLGRSTQLWDATVTSEASGKVMAEFRCVQMVLWPKG